MTRAVLRMEVHNDCALVWRSGNGAVQIIRGDRVDEIASSITQHCQESRREGQGLDPVSIGDAAQEPAQGTPPQTGSGFDSLDQATLGGGEAPVILLVDAVEVPIMIDKLRIATALRPQVIIPVIIDQSGYTIGPSGTPGLSPCVECAELWVHQEITLSWRDNGPRQMTALSAAGYALATAEAEAMAEGGIALTVGARVRHDRRTGTIEQHTVFQHPHCKSCEIADERDMQRGD